MEARPQAPFAAPRTPLSVLESCSSDHSGCTGAGIIGAMAGIPTQSGAPDTATMAERVGPKPAPPPDRLDTWVVLDLLATARRWRVRDQFVAGQTDGLSRCLVACLNAGEPVPVWLRRELVGFLLEALWEEPRPSGTGAQIAADWDAKRDSLLGRWHETAESAPPR